MILQIPLQAVPNQQFSIVLNNQQCTFNLYTRDYVDFGAPYVTGEFLVKNPDGYEETLSVNPDDPFDLLLFLTNPGSNVTAYWQRIYMDLYVSGQLIFAGQPLVYGSWINQYPNPNFKGKLFVNTTNGLDPVYTDFGTSTTLNYTDGILNTSNNP